MRKILIVKTSALGDVIHAYPAVHYLRNKFPQAQIDWVVEAPCQNLVQAHPSVTKAIPVATKAWRRDPFSITTFQAVRAFCKQLRSEKYDVVFDLQGNVKSGLITALARANDKVGFGVRSVAEKPNILFTTRRYDPPPYGNIRQDYLAIVSSFYNEEPPLKCDPVQLKISEEQRSGLQKYVANPSVMVCSGSAWKNKQLTVESLGDFLQHLQKHLGCHFLMTWGSDEEKRMAEALLKRFPGRATIVEKMSLASLQNLMGMCRLVVAVDSLPLHLAGTTATPTFSAFGPSLAQKYNPLGKRHAAYQGTCPYGRTFLKRCPVLRTCPTGACIRFLSGDALFDYFRSWWEELNL